MTTALLALLVVLPAPDALATAARLSAAAVKRPLIATALHTLEAEALLAAGEKKRALAVAEDVIRRDRRWGRRAAWTAAQASLPDDCHAALGFLEQARPDPAWIPAAPRLARLAEAQSLCKLPEVEATRRSLAVDYPYTPEGAAITDVELDPEERLKRAEALERARDYVAAEAELESLLSTPVVVEARFRIGKLHLDRLREDFGVAERAFAAVAATDDERAEEAAYLRGRALGRAGDVAGAAAAYHAYIQRFPEGAFVDDARFFRGFLDYEIGRYARCAETFGALTEGRWAAAAAWYRAWCLYRGGSPDALGALDALVAGAPAGSGAHRRAAYWAARALEPTDPKSARARLAALAVERPQDWYGLLVRQRYPGMLPAGAGLGPPVERPARRPKRRVRAVAAEVRALHEAGLDDFARRALRAKRRAFARARDEETLRRLARLVGDYRLMMGDALRDRAVLDALPTAATADVWRTAYPRAWPPRVAAPARNNGLSPTLVWSFMRKESAFDPEAVSPAHAVGLMQLLPRTAARIQEARGLGDEAVDLFDPARNIELGAWYLGALSKRFRGQIPLVAAAYNAGPTAVLSWFGSRERAPLDVFVESIPFKEARGYVKRLSATWFIYRMVHEGRSADEAADFLPLELDLRAAPGVSF